MQDIEGKVAIVTGGASGIGLASARALAVAGVRVVIADRNASGAEAGASGIREAGAEAIAFACDIAEPDAFAVLREKTIAAFGIVDIVMNNAGVILSGLPEDIPIEEWARVMDINFLSVVRSVQAFMPDMIARGAGHIVNTASFAGLYTYNYDRLPYAASKAALIQLSEGLAFYLRPKGVGVTCLCPGPVMTNIGASIPRWSEGLAIRGPGAEFSVLAPEAVGDMVVDAIRRNRFLVPTHPEVKDKLMARARDADAFLDYQIAHSQVVFPGR